MTGAKLFSNGELKRCIETTRSICPSAKIAAGFGIRDADDIKALSAIEGLDAVIIGTAFLETMSRGDQSVREFLPPLEAALKREVTRL
jgi:tryptophan synthase alpha subunit